jgi:hypothetical protein
MTLADLLHFGLDLYSGMMETFCSELEAESYLVL